MILSEYVASGGLPRVIYIGDGKNDFCPSSKLSESDHVFIKRGMRLDKLVQTEPDKIKATLHRWGDGHEIHDLFGTVLNWD